jgi:hypothetical protein
MAIDHLEGIRTAIIVLLEVRELHGIHSILSSELLGIKFYESAFKPIPIRS